MATEAQLIEALKKADAAGDTEAARAIAKRIKMVRETTGAGAFGYGVKKGFSDVVEGTKKVTDALTPISPAMGLVKGATKLAEMAGYEPGQLMDGSDNADYELVSEKFPTATMIGEIAGEVAPFLPLGFAVGAIPTTLSRVGAAGALGAAEGAIPAIGRGQSGVDQAMVGGTIAAGMEAFFPVFGRLVRGTYKRLMNSDVQKVFDENGNITPEVQKVLDANNIDVSKIKNKAVEIATKKPKNAEEAAKMARFKDQGIPFTPGDISGDMAQRGKEARLLEVQDDAAAPLRELRVTQARRLQELGDQLSEGLSVLDVEETGAQIKTAIQEAKNLSKANVSQKYDALAEAAGMKNGIPLPLDTFENIVVDPRFNSMLSGLDDTQRNKIGNILVQYGIDNTEEAVKKFTESEAPGMLARRKDVLTLTTKNKEDFVQALNGLISPTSENNYKAVIGMLKGAADDSIDMVDEVVDMNLRGLAQQARLSNVKYKQDFSPEALAGKVINMKKDGVTPSIESSKVYAKLFARGESIEQLRKTVDILQRTPVGQAGIKSLQSRMILDVIDAGFSHTSDKINGQVLFHGNRAMSYMNKLGRDKVEALFATNPDVKKQFEAILQTGIDTTPTKKEVLKGSGSALINTLSGTMDVLQFNQSPAISGVVNLLKNVARDGADVKELKRLMKNSPQLQQTMFFMNKYMPNTVAAYSLPTVATVNKLDEEEDAKVLTPQPQ